MLERTGIALVLSILLLPQVGNSCVVDLPTCETPSRGTSTTLYSDQGKDALLVTESGIDVLKDGIVFPTDFEGITAIVLCPSRKALVVRDNGYSENNTISALDLLENALNSEKVMTLRQIRRQIRKAGIKSYITKLPSDHCVCGDEIQAPVDNHCADWGQIQDGMRGARDELLQVARVIQ